LSNYFCSTNHKVIGPLYLFFGTFTAFLATFMLSLVRCELGTPDHKLFLGDYPLCSVFITGRGLLSVPVGKLGLPHNQCIIYTLAQSTIWLGSYTLRC